MTKTCVPPPLGLIRPSQSSVRFQLGKYPYFQPRLYTNAYVCTIVVVQQPIRARSCGFGEKDKRPIDPPVILQLHKESQGSLHRVRYKTMLIEEKKRLMLYLCTQHCG